MSSTELGAATFVAPASHEQERLWLAGQLAGDTPLYNLLFLVDLPGRFTAGDLTACLAAVVDRHEVLRTSLHLRGEDLVQEVHPRVPVEAPVTDLSGLDPARRQERLAEICRAEVSAPIPLEAAPLWRARLIRLDGSWRLTFVAHHTIFDAGSHRVLRAELAELADARAEGRPPDLPELDIQYADYAAWQRDRGPDLADQLACWRERLAGLPAVHGLPLDRGRTAASGHPGADLFFELPPGTGEAAEAYGRERGATRFMVMYAAFAALVARIGGRTDVAVGVPVAGRNMPELAPLLGMFVNTLVLRTDLSADPSFEELVGRVRERVLEALENQDVPVQVLIEELADRGDPAVAPLYQLGFNLLAITGHDSGNGHARDELLLELSGDEGRVEYRTDLFDRATIDRFARWYGRTLREALRDPRRPLSELSLLGDDERELVLGEFIATDAAFPADATLHGLVADQVARTPDAVAIEFEGDRLSYAELDAWAARIARRLLERGVGPESLVGIRAERCLGLVPAILGILKAGAGYLPLDPEYPAGRRDFMTADAGAEVVLTQEEIAVSRRWPDPPEDASRPAAGPGGIAYVIYTSGSTGRPKGVANTHRGVVNRLHWMQRTFRLDPSDVVVQKTPFGFDVSVWEFFWPLITGARVVLARPGGHKDPHYLRDLFASAGVTTAHFVPSMLAVYLAAGLPVGDLRLRRLICSGEELPAGLAARFRSAMPGCELHNLYGPTEAAIDVSWWPCDGGDVVPIGRPIDNIRLYVLDARGEPVPVGMPGELFIGGVGVARGYWNRPGLTAARFVPDPYGPPGSRAYRTGDAARWRADGALEFLGRLDDQIKLRGVRIELGEIATALREQPGVVDAAVTVREDTPGDRRLVAYVVGAADGLRAALQARLPEYMIPAAFIELPAVPLTPNGKLDRAALPPPPTRRSGATEPPRTEAEGLIARVWREVLGLEAVGIDEDFYDLGGHSLLAIRVVAGIRDRTNGRYPRRIGVTDLLAHRTVRELAAHLETSDGPSGTRPLLQELTRVPRDQTALTYVCIPYGGGNASVFQPLAEALPDGTALFGITLPGHDVGIDEEDLSFEEIATRCTAEILERVEGPLVLYGHCGIGAALMTEVGHRLEERDRPIEAIYVGGAFPNARPRRGPLRWAERFGDLASNRRVSSWVQGMGVDVAQMGAAEAELLVAMMRSDARSAEDYFADLFERDAPPLRTPIITIVGSADPMTEFYLERYADWRFVTESRALVVLAEAGHYFIRYRAEELADIITRVHRNLDAGLRTDTWWVAAADRGAETNPAAAASLRRFAAVAIGQTVTLIGSALTAWAVPLYTYLRNDSLWDLAILSVFGIAPWLIASPVAGVAADRFDRRRVMMASGLTALTAQAVMLVLLLTGTARLGHLVALVFVLGMAAAFQRLAYTAAIPQLVPMRYLGHAMGAVQLTGGTATLIAPMVAAGLLAALGLPGIVAVDIATFVVSLAVLARVRFARVSGERPAERFWTEVSEGIRYTWRHRGLRTMICFSAVINVLTAPVILLVGPVVLAFGNVVDVGQAALAEAVGGFVGGLAMTVWGGPRRYRLRGAVAFSAVAGLFAAVAGLRPSLPLIAAGMFGFGAAAALIQSLYATLIEAKVPQRFHGRVLAWNTTVTWSTLPIGWVISAALAGPTGGWLAPGGALSGTAGAVLGVGPGRSMGLLLVLTGLAMIAAACCALAWRTFRAFDVETPDSVPDDLVGVRNLGAR